MAVPRAHCREQNAPRLQASRLDSSPSDSGETSVFEDLDNGIQAFRERLAMLVSSQ